MQRIIEEDLSLECEQQDQRKQQTCDRSVIEFGEKLFCKVFQSSFSDHQHPCQYATAKRYYNKQHYR